MCSTGFETVRLLPKRTAVPVTVSIKGKDKTMQKLLHVYVHVYGHVMSFDPPV